MGKKLVSPETDQLRRALQSQLEPIVQDHEAVLVDVEIAGSHSQPTLRLLVHKEPGVSLAECEAISREVADFLDLEDPLPGRYRLEVTSPGLDRPLVTDGDFARANGRLLKVVMASGKNYGGRLVEWDSTLLWVERKGGERDRVQRSEIAKATIEAEFRSTKG